MKSWTEIGKPHWFDYSDLYDDALDRVPDGGTIVEVGSWLGRSICYLGQRANELGRQVNLISVDRCRGPYDDVYMDTTVREHCGSIAGGLHANMAACGIVDFTTLIVGDSVSVAKLFDASSVDFVFIDAAHEYEYVKADLEAWWSKVKPGGLFAGHDYAGNGWPGVKEAVDEFFASSADFVPHEPFMSVNCWSADRKDV